MQPGVGGGKACLCTFSSCDPFRFKMFFSFAVIHPTGKAKLAFLRKMGGVKVPCVRGAGSAQCR